MFGTPKKEQGYFCSASVMQIPIDEISRNPDQTRRNFAYDKLMELAVSIAENGLLQPLTVTFEDGHPVLLAGERRLRAAKLAGLRTVPCVRADHEGADRAVLTLAENLQRESLNPFEEAQALARLVQVHGMRQEEIAYRLGYAQPTVANKLRLLRLTAEQRARMVQAGLTERHARALLRIENEQQRDKLLDRIIREKLTVAGTERMVEALCSGKKRVLPPPLLRDVRLFSNTLEKAMQNMLRAGIPAQSEKNETEEYIEYLVRIPKKPA